MASLMFRALVRVGVAVPLAAALLAAFAWWGARSARLAAQIDRHEPTAMRFSDAVASSRDGDVYVRMDDAQLDCEKSLLAPAGTTFALVDGDGRVAAMARLPSCDERAASPLVGVFQDPPYLLYGEAVARGWSVTPGHLAYVDTRAGSFDAWTRVLVAIAGGAFTAAYAACVVAARRSRARRRAWRVRALGLWFLAMTPWLAYMAHDYVVLRVVPVSVIAAVAGLVAFAFALVPDHPYVVKVTRRLAFADEA